MIGIAPPGFTGSSIEHAAIGLGIALLGALGSLLTGIGPADPASFGAAGLVILLVGAAASYVPARRALHVDPSRALRSN